MNRLVLFKGLGDVAPLQRELAVVYFCFFGRSGSVVGMMDVCFVCWAYTFLSFNPWIEGVLLSSTLLGVIYSSCRFLGLPGEERSIGAGVTRRIQDTTSA